MKAKPTTETEIKLKVADADAARLLLRGAGFRLHKWRVFEDNVILDSAGLKLRKAGALLRVREAGGEATLTYKGKAAAGKHKVREELETGVSDAGAFARIAERLGFTPKFRYQKYRTEFQEPDGKGVATLDETPIGIYLELEGPPEWIDRTAQRLGFREADYITESYGALYFAWCREQRVTPGQMVFQDQ
jgi:adenylate cyclase class 2